MIPVARIYRARFLRHDEREDTWKLRFGNFGAEMPIAPGDGKWLMFTPYGASRPWEHGLWRGFGKLWLLKQLAIDDWGKHSELHGNGIKVGIPPKIGEPNHGNKNLRAQLAQDLADMGANSTLVLPPGFDFKLVEATANTWEMFRAQIEMANSAMSVMAIGTNLPTEVGNSASTGATAQNLVRLDYKRADAEALSTATHDQSLVWWAEFNYGDRGLAPWPLWDVVPPADQQAKAGVMNTVATSLKTFKEAGTPIDDRKVLEEYELPIKEGASAEAPTPDADLPAIAAAHNAAHADPARQTTVETLRAVWERGAALATGDDCDAWAMGRVTAFLHLLAAGEPEHPAYVADNDLLPDGHERAARVAALGSPSQPRDDHGRWTDGPGGRDAASGEASSTQRTKTHERLERSERRDAERADRRADRHEQAAKQREAKAEAARKRADDARREADELEKVREERDDDLAVLRTERDEAHDESVRKLDPTDPDDVREEHRQIAEIDRDIREAESSLKAAEKAAEAAERRAVRSEEVADGLRDEVATAKQEAHSARETAKLKREHADILAAPPQRYIDATRAKHSEAKAGLELAERRAKDADAAWKRAHDDVKRADDELADARRRNAPAEEIDAARERLAKARSKEDAAEKSAEDANEARDDADRREEFWSYRARDAKDAISDHYDDDDESDYDPDED